VSSSPPQLSDSELVDALRRNEPRAYATFIARFRPALEAYARRANIPRWEWAECITELLSDEALRLAMTRREPPRNIAAYLVRAVRNKYLYTKRAASCRLRNHVAASVDRFGERIIPSTCSDFARRMSAGPDAGSSSPPRIVARMMSDVSEGLSAEDRQLLTWVAEGITRGVIAEWMGISRDACAKRVWRLCRRLRADVVARSHHLDPRDRAELERFIRHTEDCPGLAPMK
jgi:DNA-directed RNA polymerase specialized sigma24 family protein